MCVVHAELNTTDSTDIDSATDGQDLRAQQCYKSPYIPPPSHNYFYRAGLGRKTNTGCQQKASFLAGVRCGVVDMKTSDYNKGEIFHCLKGDCCVSAAKGLCAKANSIGAKWCGRKPVFHQLYDFDAESYKDPQRVCGQRPGGLFGWVTKYMNCGAGECCFDEGAMLCMKGNGCPAR
jgi:hypothetical protein